MEKTTDKTEVKLSKITKIIGIIDVIVFLIPTVLCFWKRNIIAALCFIPFIFLGILLLWAYKKQKIIIEDHELIFKYLIKKTQHIRYTDIRCLLLIPLNNKIQKVLIDREYHRLITLDEMLMNLDFLIETLNKKEIQILDFGEMVEKGQNVSSYLGALNVIERNFYKSIASENKTMEHMSKEEMKFDIKKSKKILKIIGWILILSNGAAFLIGGKGMFFIFVAILLIAYVIYIRYYPYIYIDTVSKKGKNKSLQMPFLGPVIAILLCITISKLYNYDFVSFMKITVCLTIILAVPFFIKSAKTSIPQHFGRKISVLFAAFVIGFTITFPVNFLLTFDAAVHDTVWITDKDIGSGKTRDYYLYAQWNGREEKFNVSKSEYSETSIGDRRRVCIQKSLLGLKYYTIHE